MTDTRATQKPEEGLYITTVFTVTTVQVRKFNFSALQSASQLLKNGTKRPITQCYDQ